MHSARVYRKSRPQWISGPCDTGACTTPEHFKSDYRTEQRALEASWRKRVWETGEIQALCCRKFVSGERGFSNNGFKARQRCRSCLIKQPEIKEEETICKTYFGTNCAKVSIPIEDSSLPVLPAAGSMGCELFRARCVCLKAFRSINILQVFSCLRLLEP